MILITISAQPFESPIGLSIPFLAHHKLLNTGAASEDSQAFIDVKSSSPNLTIPPMSQCMKLCIGKIYDCSTISFS